MKTLDPRETNVVPTTERHPEALVRVPERTADPTLPQPTAGAPAPMTGMKKSAPRKRSAVTTQASPVRAPTLTPVALSM